MNIFICSALPAISSKSETQSLKILLVSPAGIGGIQSFCTAISEGFCQAGHKVHILFEQTCPSAEPRPRIPAGVEVGIIEQRPFGSYYHTIKRMADFIHGGCFDVVYPNTSSVVYRALGLLGPARPVAVGGCLTQGTHDYNTNAEFVDYLDHIFADGPASVQNLTRRLENSSVGITMIPHGVRPAIRSGVRLPSGPMRLVYVGRLVAEKRIPDMIEVAKMLRDKNVPFQFAIVGDGPLRSELEGQTRSFGLQANVKFLGFLTHEEMDIVLQTSDVSLLLSESEGFGITALETMNIGCVPVVTNTCGCTVAIRDSLNGFVVPVGDVERVTNCIIQLDANREWLGRMSQEAIRTIQLEFSLKKEVERHLEVIRQARFHHSRCAAATKAWQFVSPGVLDHPWVPVWLTETLRKSKHTIFQFRKS